MHLQIEHLSKEYATRSEPLVVLRDVSLALAAGQSAAIVGPSGSGKSTLLNIVGGLEPPSAGSVRLGEQNPWDLDPAGLAAFRNRQIGFVFQDHHLLPQCSVLENVLLPTLAAGPTTTEQIERAKALLERVRLTARLAHRPAELSGGERQRVALARALIQRPALLLADEPTGNLDQATADVVADLLLELQQAEATLLLVVTHSERLARRMQRRFRLEVGQLASDAA